MITQVFGEILIHASGERDSSRHLKFMIQASGEVLIQASGDELIQELMCVMRVGRKEIEAKRMITLR